MRSDQATSDDAMIPTDRHGSVVAAAGCGKTEQIVLTTKGYAGCRLILTHTHSGVDALRRRFKEHKVGAKAYRIETIAGWCLRYTSSFPQRAGRKVAEPSDDASWQAVYAATVRLIESGAVDRVLPASYPVGSYEISITESALCSSAILFAARPQIAAGEPAKDRRRARVRTLALQGVEDFLYGVSHSP